MNVRNARRAAGLIAGAAVAGLLSGCVGNPFEEAKVDPASPVAAEVSKLARANKDYPSFSEVPAKPTDIRPLRMYGQQARDIEVARAKLERETAPETWTLSNTEAFAAGARTAAGPEIAPADPRDTEAFANDLRQRATPPPPPKR
ncbi:MAG: hypothetical protein ABW360_03375 [Phenylobacterium sp.]